MAKLEVVVEEATEVIKVTGAIEVTEMSTGLSIKLNTREKEENMEIEVTEDNKEELVEKEEVASIEVTKMIQARHSQLAKSLVIWRGELHEKMITK